MAVRVLIVDKLTVMLCLHEKWINVHIGMKISLKSNRDQGEITKVWFTLVWQFMLVSCKQILNRVGWICTIWKSPWYNVHTPLFKSGWVWTSLLSLKLNNNIKQLILQVRHKFKASFKNIVQADCWSCLTFPHHIAKKLTTASLNGGWLPETSRSFHYWQPASIWRLVPWLANAPPYKKWSQAALTLN